MWEGNGIKDRVCKENNVWSSSIQACGINIY